MRVHTRAEAWRRGRGSRDNGVERKGEEERGLMEGMRVKDLYKHALPHSDAIPVCVGARTFLE